MSKILFTKNIPRNEFGLPKKYLIKTFKKYSDSDERNTEINKVTSKICYL